MPYVLRAGDPSMVQVLYIRACIRPPVASFSDSCTSCFSFPLMHFSFSCATFCYYCFIHTSYSTICCSYVRVTYSQLMRPTHLSFARATCPSLEKITCRPLMHKTPELLAKHFLYVKGLLSLDFLSFLRLRTAVHLQMY